MRRRRARRAARAALAVALVVVVTPPAAGQDTTEPDADHRGSPERGDAESRVTEVPARVVDLTVRTGWSDGSVHSEATPDRRTVTMATDVLFDLDRSSLNSDARARIDALAEDLNALGPRTVTIEGHTDDQGSVEHNQGLSDRRAEAVRARFAVQLDRGFTLEAAGYGEHRPAVPNLVGGAPDPENRARNRRVVVSFPLD